MTDQNNKVPEEQKPEQEHLEAIAVETSALAVMERAEIDMQIATAKRWPRSLSVFTKKAIAMVSIDEETNEKCLYCRPVGKSENGEIEYARGESIRLAEIVAGCYGNIRVAGMITEMAPRYVKAIGIAHDLENNYAAKAEAVEATVTRQGFPFSERMRVVVAKAAQSKAIRDAIFRIVPKSLCKSIIAVAQDIALGKGEPLETRRTRVIEWINKLGIEPIRVYTAIGVKGPKELDNDKLAVLTGLKTAIKDGDTTIDDAFPPITKDVTQEQGVNGLRARLGAQAPTIDGKAPGVAQDATKAPNLGQRPQDRKPAKKGRKSKAELAAIALQAVQNSKPTEQKPDIDPATLPNYDGPTEERKDVGEQRQFVSGFGTV